jgi:hypothetical protein
MLMDPPKIVGIRMNVDDEEYSLKHEKKNGDKDKF